MLCLFLLNNHIIPNHTFTEMGITSPLATYLQWDNTQLYNFEEIHSHNFYDILVYFKGGGKHTIDFKTEIITDCSIHIVSKNSTHRANRGVHSDGFSLLFTDLFLDQLQEFDKTLNYKEFMNSSRFMNLNTDEFTSLTYIFDELKNNQNNQSLFLNMLAALLIKLISLKEMSIELNKTDKTVSAYIDFINNHCLEPQCISNFIKTQKLNELMLRRLIKKVTGKTPLQLLHEKIHFEAQKMLFNTSLSIKEIGYSLGFENESFFCKQFKLYAHVTPKQFRIHAQKEI